MRFLLESPEAGETVGLIRPSFGPVSHRSAEYKRLSPCLHRRTIPIQWLSPMLVAKESALFVRSPDGKLTRIFRRLTETDTGRKRFGVAVIAGWRAFDLCTSPPRVK